MAKRFVRIDLSEGARDFRAVAIEPGVPTLDRPGASAKILFKWLGGMVAEPEWQGDCVDFFVRDDHGGRLEEVVCQPASSEDLQGLLKDDLALLAERLEKAKADSSTERTVLKAIRQQFAALMQDPHRMDRDCCFFRYRDVQGRWRLVWCPGYQRTDQEPAAPVICTDPDCNLLFVRRPHKSAKCPGCSTTPGMLVQRRKRRKWPLAAALLLLMIGGALAWYSLRNPLSVSPERWTARVRDRTEFRVTKSFLFWTWDVSREAAASGDPKVVRVDAGTLRAEAVAPGTASVDFHVDNHSVTVAVTVEPPSRLRIEPAKIELVRGKSANVELLGVYEDGEERDLTTDAQWASQREDIASVRDGLVQGLGVGPSTVTARYGARPQMDPASADVFVEEQPFERLELAIAPPRIIIGQESQVSVQGVFADGVKRRLAPDSPGLMLEVDPEGRATVERDTLTGKQEGKGTLKAVWKQNREPKSVTETSGFDVIKRLAVTPRSLEVKVGEVAELRVDASSEPPVTLTSTDPGCATVDGRQVKGVKAGKTQITIAQGDQTQTIQVSVSEPPSVAKSGPPIAGPGGVPPKPGSPPVPTLRTLSEIRIVSNQGDSVRFPVGSEFSDFRVEARFKDGFTRVVTTKATLLSDPSGPGPVSFANGRMLGLREGQTTVNAEFGGVRSQQGLRVEVTADVDIDEIRLSPAAISILRGETVTLEAIGYKQGKSVGAIANRGDRAPSEGWSWESSDEKTAHAAGPAVTGVELGTARITARLGSVKSKPADVTVREQIAELLAVEPNGMHLWVGEVRRIGTDLTISQGGMDVSRLVGVSSEDPGKVRYDSDRHALVGVSPGLTQVAFSRGDRLVAATVEVSAGPLRQGEVIVEPADSVLSPGQAVELHIFLVTKEGLRLDRSGVAKLASSAPDKVQISGQWACALGPGTAQITAALPVSEASRPGGAAVTVDDNPIVGLVVEPATIAMSVGDHHRVRVLGQSASGTRELFPQDKLKLSVSGPNPKAIRLVGSQHVDAVAPGAARVHVAWDDKLRGEVAVTVLQGPWTDLRIQPSAATVHPGQLIKYSVTGVRAGRRRPVPLGELNLAVRDTAVAETRTATSVRATSPGLTKVVAQVGSLQAEADLSVTAGKGTGGVAATTDGGAVQITGPEGWIYDVGPGGVVWTEWDWDWGSVPPPDRVRIEPNPLELKVGETTPRLTVVAQSETGLARLVPATLKSLDEKVLAPVGGSPGRFIAKSPGSTRVRATYRGLDLYADVTVSGRWFTKVDMTPSTYDRASQSSTVRVRVLAPSAEAPLEYRLFGEGSSPPAGWKSAVAAGGQLQVELESGPLKTEANGTWHTLIIEARRPGDARPQQYRCRFFVTPPGIKEAAGT